MDLIKEALSMGFADAAIMVNIELQICRCLLVI